MNETSTAAGSTGEVLSRRCVALLKTALKPDVWPNAELKLAWFDKLLHTVKVNFQESILLGFVLKCDSQCLMHFFFFLNLG